mgnify:FL=1
MVPQISMIVPAEEIGRSEWHKVMSINLEAAFFLSQAFGRQMLAQGSGSIVNVASLPDYMGSSTVPLTMHPSMA